METLSIKDEYIKLGQAIKLAGLADSGAEAKELIADGFVKVNGAVEFQRGKKLHNGDIVEYDGNEFMIKV